MTSRADQLLASAGVHLGDEVRIEDEGRAFEGRLMPRHAFSQEDVVIVKLGSGYNVGVTVSPKARVTLVRRSEARAKPSRPPTAGKDRPRVALLGTGGTIASFVDYRTGAVHPAATAEELAFATPELFDVANVESEVVFQVFSEDLEPQNWTELAKRVKAAFDRGVAGVVIPHGTDTLHYTAAALSFALEDLPGPVVLVGAQRSSDRPSSDAAGNLLAAVRVAATADLGEVVIVMHATSSDDAFAIHRGTRARKNHTSRRDAFESINAPPLGRVLEDGIELSGHRRRSPSGLKLHERFETRCRLLWSNPLTGPQDLRADGVRGILVAGTGLGHLPRRGLDAVRAATTAGVLIAMSSQCLWGRVNLDVYSTGRDLLERGVVPADDMLPEVAFVKLMWALGQTREPAEARRLFLVNRAGESSPTTPFANEATL